MFNVAKQVAKFEIEKSVNTKKYIFIIFEKVLLFYMLQ